MQPHEVKGRELKKKARLKDFHIETLDGSGSYNFFTPAEDSKKALKQLMSNSSDFKNIVRGTRDLTIIIKRI